MFPDLVPARPQGWIMPSVFTGTNAELIAAVAPMYLTGSVLDVTYGNGDTAGGWWRRFTPNPFTFHDLDLDGVDFRCLPHPDRSFASVTYDPPYVHSGTEATTAGVADFRRRFGLAPFHGSAGPLPLILDGLHEVLRVADRFVLVKCMEFAQGSVVSPSHDGERISTFHDIPHEVTMLALQRGWVKHDQIVHHTGPGPGGHNIFEPIRARRHHSYLIVFTR